MAHPSNIAAGCELELAEALFKLLLQILRHNRGRISTLLEACNKLQIVSQPQPSDKRVGFTVRFDRPGDVDVACLYLDTSNLHSTILLRSLTHPCRSGTSRPECNVGRITPRGYINTTVMELGPPRTMIRFVFGACKLIIVVSLDLVGELNSGQWSCRNCQALVFGS